MPAPDLYFAFLSGSIEYACQPCGQCCKGLGFDTWPAQVESSSELIKLAPFMAKRPGAEKPLASFYTFADGCRYLGDDNLCDLHRMDGPQAKPLICRLFPFSRLVDLDGLWVVLPMGGCPWTAVSDDTLSPLSDHGAILQELPDALLQRIAPEAWASRTAHSVKVRKQLEHAIRDGLRRDMAPQSWYDWMSACHEQYIGPAAAPAKDAWLDLLRCAGEPEPLNVPTQRLLVASLPALRIVLCRSVPDDELPAALLGFALWLQATQEIARRSFHGADLLHFLERATPMLRVLGASAKPVEQVWPNLDETPPEGWPQGFLDTLRHLRQERLGEALTSALRFFRHGTVPVLHKVGRALSQQL